MIPQFAMWAAAACYCIAAGGYALEGKPWMTMTMLLYGGSALTVWMGGNR